MLRESVDALPPTMADDDAAATSRARLLESFVDAAVGDDPDRAERSRRALVEAFGPEWLVDAAAVVANFEMMTRLADGTGARLRPAQIEATAMLRAELGIDAFASRR